MIVLTDLGATTPTTGNISVYMYAIWINEINVVLRIQDRDQVLVVCNNVQRKGPLFSTGECEECEDCVA